MASRAGLFDFEFDKKSIFDAEVNPAGVFDAEFATTTAAGGDVTVALTGVSASSAVGTLGVALAIGLSGITGTGAVGIVTPSTSAALVGQAVAGSVGAVSTASTLNLSGVSAPGEVGTATPATTLALTGVAATGSVGTVTASIGGDVTVALTGVTATGSIGSVAPSVALTLAGLQASGVTGTVTPATSRALTGQGATSSVGTVTPTVARALTGIYAALPDLFGGGVRGPDGLEYYLTGVASDLSNEAYAENNTLDTTPAPSADDTVHFGSSQTFAWWSPAGVPGTTQFPQGIYRVYAQLAGWLLDIQASIQRVDAAGALQDTFVGSLQPAEDLVGSQPKSALVWEIDCQFSPGAADDRLLLTLFNSRSQASSWTVRSSQPSLSAASTLALSGVAGTGDTGTLAPSTTRALTGSVATGAVGTVSVAAEGDVTVALTGVSATGSIGTVVASVTGGVTPASTSGGSGGVAWQRPTRPIVPGPSADVTVALTGVAAVGQVGRLSASRACTLSGVVGWAHTGAVSPRRTWPTDDEWLLGLIDLDDRGAV